MKNKMELAEAKSAIAVRQALGKPGLYSHASLMLLLTSSLVLSPKAVSQSLTTVAPTKSLSTTVAPSKTLTTTVDPIRTVAPTKTVTPTETVTPVDTVATRTKELQARTTDLTTQKDLLSADTQNINTTLKAMQRDLAATALDIQAIQKTQIRLLPELKSLESALTKYTTVAKTLENDAQSVVSQTNKTKLSIDDLAKETQDFVATVKSPTTDILSLQSTVATVVEETKTLQAEQVKSVQAIQLLQTDILKYQQLLSLQLLAVNNPVAASDSVIVAADENAIIDLSTKISDVDNDADLNTIDLEPSVNGIQKSIMTSAGQWTVTETGVLTLNPSQQFEGESVISYTVMDTGGRQSQPANITVLVGGASPVATSDTASANPDSAVMVDLSDNVSDSNNDVLINSIDLHPGLDGIQKDFISNDGVWKAGPDGIVLFTPVAGFEGDTTAAYVIQDDDGNVSNTAIISITVAGATPIATDVLVSTSEPKTNIDITKNISDPNNDVLLSSIDLDPTTKGIQKTLTTSAGIWNVSLAGIVSFTPELAFEGNAAILFTAQDDDGNTSAPATMTVQVAGANPVATSESISIKSDSMASGDLSDNVSDANNDVVIGSIDLDPNTKNITKSLSTTDGVWSIDETGTFTFIPASGFEGEARISYTVKDDDGNTSAPAQLLVTVAGATPVVTPESINTSANTIATTDLSDNLSDANNDVVVSSIDLDPATPGIQSMLTTPAGSWAVDEKGIATFEPAQGFEGVASIPYSVEDDDGNISATANLEVTVAGANPVATTSSTSVAPDTIANIDLSNNVSDANNDVVLSSIDLDPATPGIQPALSTVEGLWTVGANGAVTFKPAPGFEGIATVPYTVADDDGNVSDVSSISVIVSGAPPIAAAVMTSVNPDTTASIDLTNNVSDPNNDVVMSSIDLDPATPGNQNTISTPEGNWSVNENGTVTFDPVASFEGNATILYTVDDDDANKSPTAAISVIVAGAVPIATSDSTSVNANTLATLDLKDNISDANDDVVISSIDLDPATPGQQTTLRNADGGWSVSANAVTTFVPVSSFQGTASIPYTVTDDDGNVSAPADLSVTVAGAVPIASTDSTSVGPNTTATLDLSDNVVDANNNVAIDSIDLDPTIPGTQSSQTTADGSWSVSPVGTVTFIPQPGFEGTASIPYSVQDDNGNVSALASISVTVAGAIPTATNDSVSVAPDTTADIDLSDNVNDANNDLVLSSIDLDPATPNQQTTLSTADGSWSINQTGAITFDPKSSFEGTAVISYNIKDDDGNVSSAATVSVTVAGAPPVATEDSTSVGADAIATLDLTDNVSDANNDVVISSIDLDPSVPGSQSTITTSDGTWSINPTGTVSFDPVSSFEGTSSIPFTVEDDDGNVAVASIISVTVAGAPPIATAKSTAVDTDTVAILDMTGSVSDPNNDVLIDSIDLDPGAPGNQNTLITEEGEWSVSSIGTVTFDPIASFEGTVSIPYTVKDDDDNTATPSQISVTVYGAIPVATNDNATVAPDTLASIDLSDNVSDANNDIVIGTIDLDPSTPGIQTSLSTNDGEWSVNAAGTVTFDPIASFEGTTSIPYTISDDNGNVSVNAVVSVTVDGASPVVTDDSTSVAPYTIANLDVTDNTSDPNNDVVISTIDLEPTTPGIQNTLTTADGVWNVTAQGKVTFAPVESFEGTASIPYSVEDDDGNISVAANLSVTVDGATPVATGDNALVQPDTDALLDLTDNVSDANNDVLIGTIDLDPTSAGVQSTFSTVDGDWSHDGSGTVTFNPVASFEETTLIEYTVSDDDGNVSLPAVLTVTVESASPIADSESVSGVQNVSANIDVLDGDVDANNDIDNTTLDLDPTAPGVQSSFIVLDEGEFTVINGEVVFTPEPGFFGTTSVDYTVTDAKGNVSNVATATVDIQIDSDGDGVPNITDLDDDNDGISDIVEGNGDTDGDGYPDRLDLDSDNDGLNDALEAGDPDLDGNGIIDGFADTDSDGIDDTAAVQPLPVPDTDADGKADYIDVDSDNDGLSDTLEAEGEDTDGNGILDNFIDLDNDGRDDDTALTPLFGVDHDGDGRVDHLDLDSDNDGLPDTIEAGGTDVDSDGIIDDFTDTDGDGMDDSTVSRPLAQHDTDGDGTPDHLDLDSDNDAIPDVIEAGGSNDTRDGHIDAFTDSDNNGLDDATATQPLPVHDTDSDGIPNHLDLDSDNDGIADVVEAIGIDSDNNGMIDLFNDADGDGFDDVAALTPLSDPDSDGDGNADRLDSDSDADGVPDEIESTSDSDSDGLYNYLDTDSDNDGMPDSIEAGSNPAIPVDTDNDGTPDYTELDSDNDGIPDAIEAGSDPAAPIDTDSDGTPDYIELDSDNDGIPDAVEAGSDPATLIDTDSDDIPDYTELDSDSDGIPDAVEAGSDPATPIDSDNDGAPDYVEQDSDNDGIPDSIEAGTSPASPVDTDADGLPDYLDPDSDNDGVSDTVEAGDNPALPTDSDNNGRPDFQEAGSDYDGDGLSDAIEGTVDTDNDSIPDYKDTDSDNDTIPDSVEATFKGQTPADRDSDNIPDYIDVDADNDGISDAFEGHSDTDADGVQDFRDLDVDNDGILDIIEARIGMLDVNQLDTDLNGTVDISNPYGSNGMADIVETDIDSGIENYALPDIDNDGVLDFRDLDSDNDGLFDTFESSHADANLDGIIDSAERAGKNALIPNSIRNIYAVSEDTGLAAGAGGVPDNTDADGLADFRDVDSDNDGLMDVVESFGAETDLDNNGIFDDFIDDDGNGVNDIAEANPAVPTDTDADGNHDAIQLDADSDGISDLVEAGGDDIDNNGIIDDFTDSDQNGADDAITAVPLIPADTDGDSTPDFQDLDSDNDGLSDIVESGGTDANGDNKADAPALAAALPDTDGDSIPDYLEIAGASNTNEEPAALAATGSILTGLDGSGCAVGSLGTAKTGLDPTLPALAMLALLSIGRKLRYRKN